MRRVAACYLAVLATFLVGVYFWTVNTTTAVAPNDLEVLLVGALGMLGAAVALVGGDIAHFWRTWRMARAGARCGLHRRVPRPRRDDDEDRDDARDFQGLDWLPLFRLAARPMRTPPRWVLEGNLAGPPVRVFDHDRQTVALLPDLALGLRFYRGPALSKREIHFPGWHRQLGLVVVEELPAEFVERSAVILADPNDAGAELPSWLREQLTVMADWVVESDGGVVLVYKHEWLVPPRELERFLETVRRIADALNGPGRPAAQEIAESETRPLHRQHFRPAE
jgi:hypothetical protein